MRAILFLTLSLTAAAGAQARPATPSERQAIVQWAVRTLPDPYEIRSTAISDVVPVTGRDGTPIQVICVQMNVRNGFGGYTGTDHTAFTVTPEGLRAPGIRSQVDTSTCYQRPIAYRPFPELGRIQ